MKVTEYLIFQKITLVVIRDLPSAKPYSSYFFEVYPIFMEIS